MRTTIWLGVTGALALFVVAAGCRSTAPYTAASAAINTGVAAGVSAAQRTAGGCWTPCTHGTVCNPHTGFCEREAPVDATCRQLESGAVTCAPVVTTAPTGVADSTAPPRETGQPVRVPGLSPATGTTPTLPPAKASPENP